MAFRCVKTVPDGDLKTIILGNSVVIALGDPIVPGATGHAKFAVQAASTTGRILGVVVSIVGLNGKVLELNNTTVASNNETVGKIAVVYIPSYLPVEYEIDMSAALATTTDSDGIGVSFNMSSTHGQLDESSVALFSATQKQVVSAGQSDFVGAPNTRIIGHFAQSLTI